MHKCVIDIPYSLKCHSNIIYELNIYVNKYYIFDGLFFEIQVVLIGL